MKQSSIRVLREQLDDTVGCLRRGEFAAGSDELARLIDVVAAKLASSSGSALASRLLPSLKRTLDAQARGDFLFVADLLQYEIAPVLLGDDDSL